MPNHSAAHLDKMRKLSIEVRQKKALEKKQHLQAATEAKENEEKRIAAIVEQKVAKLVPELVAQLQKK